MQVLDNESVVLALEGIVQNFSKEIGPFAVELAEQLSHAFLQYAKKSQQQANNDEDYDG